MPWVEIWVDDEGPTDKQIAVVKKLVETAFSVEQDRGVDVDLRERLIAAANDVAKEFPIADKWPDHPVYPIDKKYRDWMLSQQALKA